MKRTFNIFSNTIILSLLVSQLVLLGGPALAATGDTSIVSHAYSLYAMQANSESNSPSLSADGRFVAFESDASNLVSGDTNGAMDIFVYDSETGLTERVSIDSSGVEANDGSYDPSLSADGRFVAFQSYASNLVSGDTNGAMDIFVRDRETGLTERVSVSSNGEEANSWSYSYSLSADGRFVAFESYASNLVSGDVNEQQDIFVHDRETGLTERVSVSSSGEGGNGWSTSPSLSADGRFVAFQSYASNLVSGDTNGVMDIFVYDSETGLTERVSVDPSGVQATGASYSPSLSADGRFVAFESLATNLVSGDTNWTTDIFVRDRETGLTERVSVSSNGEEANGASYSPSLSADGRFVAFESLAANLVSSDVNWLQDVFVYDRQMDLIERVSVSSSEAEADSESNSPSLSADGGFVAFESLADNLVSGDTNGVTDIFVYDRETSETECVSLGLLTMGANSGSESPSLSADGRSVAFESLASNLVSDDTNGWQDVFVYDRQTNEIERVSVSSSGAEADSASYSPSLSADGRFVAFESYATNLVSGDTNGMQDIFVHDNETGLTERVSVSSSGVQATGASSSPSLSTDGRFVAFASDASNLVSGDTNWTNDIFVRDRETGLTERVSVSSSGAQADGASSSPSFSADGRSVAFVSSATNLVSGDTNGTIDIFVYDRETAVTERVSVSSSGVQANNESYSPSLSADGRFVAFQSYATNLVSGDTNGVTDIFVYDRETAVTERVSVSSSGVQANAWSYSPSLSANGRFVTFQSLASNLVSGDTNGVTDIFVYDRQTDRIERVSVDPSGVQANNESYSPSLSADGDFVAFVSSAGNLVGGDWNTQPDIFLHELSVDNTAPTTVTVVSSTTPDGVYSVESVIDITITFSVPVNVTGVPQLTLETGITDRVASYSSGSGSNTLTFRYTIQAGDSSSDLEYVSVNSLTLNGGTIKDFANNSATLTLPAPGVTNSLSANKAIVIETSAPVVSSIVRTGNTPSDSASVDFTVTFSEAVTGVKVSDFRLTTTGSSGAAVNSVSGFGATYTVGVNTGSGNGSIRLDVPASATITDLAGNLIGGLPFTTGETYTILKAATFSDVEKEFWAWQYVERLYNAKITGGCNTDPLEYCPGSTVTRAQMAVFLLKGIHGSSYSPPAVGSSTGFGDVPTEHWAGKWIKQLAVEKITGGCGDGNYCPDAAVTRAQMSIFLLKAKYGASYTPPAVGSSTGFGDVDADHWAAKWIKQLAAEGITGGCGNGNYCPDTAVTRAQMAVFLVKTFSLP